MPVHASVTTSSSGIQTEGGNYQEGPSTRPDPWLVAGSYGLTVGLHRRGWLNIADGGVVSVESGAGSDIAAGSAGRGTATVTGDGSRWNAGESLAVGRDGPGTLTIENGGRWRIRGVMSHLTAPVLARRRSPAPVQSGSTRTFCMWGKMAPAR